MTDQQSIQFLLFALRSDRPDGYMYVRYADDLNTLIREGACMPSEVGITEEELRVFQLNALHAQALVIMRDLNAREVLVHPILVDPAKLMGMLAIYGVDEAQLQKIESKIYGLARGTARSRNVGDALSGGEARDLIARLGQEKQRPSDLHVIITIMGTRTVMPIGDVITWFMNEEPGVQRTSVTTRILRLRAALSRTDLPFVIEVKGAKISGDLRTVSLVLRKPLWIS